MSPLPSALALLMRPRQKMRTRRLVRCDTCALPPRLCVCAEMPRVACATDLVLLIHHIEANKSTNTGRLAALTIPSCRVAVRGHRDAPRVELPDGVRKLVLYPSPEARVLSPDEHARGPFALIVPDGTWPQARRAARRDPLARDAEHVALPEVPETRYRLRRRLREGTLCTFEAIAYAIGVLEGAGHAEPLLAFFDTYMERAVWVREGREQAEHEPPESQGERDRAL